MVQYIGSGTRTITPSRCACTQYEFRHQDFVGQDTCHDSSPPQEYHESSLAYLYHDLSQMPAHCEPSPLPAHPEPPLVSCWDPQKRDTSPDALELRLISVKSSYLNFDSYESYAVWQEARDQRHKEKESKDQTTSWEDREKNVLQGKCPSVWSAKVQGIDTGRFNSTFIIYILPFSSLLFYCFTHKACLHVHLTFLHTLFIPLMQPFPHIPLHSIMFLSPS